MPYKFCEAILAEIFKYVPNNNKKQDSQLF